jgi:hypothetical protein
MNSACNSAFVTLVGGLDIGLALVLEPRVVGCCRGSGSGDELVSDGGGGGGGGGGDSVGTTTPPFEAACWLSAWVFSFGLYGLLVRFATLNQITLVIPADNSGSRADSNKFTAWWQVTANQWDTSGRS